MTEKTEMTKSAPARRRRKRIIRALLAVFSCATAGTILLNLHDYPQTLNFAVKAMRGDEGAQTRRWRGIFYFFNEAGSGIKFFVTGNEKYMAHFPSPSHIVASRTARAEGGDWQAQILLAQMYQNGEWVKQDDKKSRQWQTRARQTMPPNLRSQYPEN